MPTLAQAQLYAIYTRRGACYAIIVPTRDSQHTSRSCAHRLPLCAWADGPGCPWLSLPAFPAALHTLPFQRPGWRIFKRHEKQRTPISPLSCESSKDHLPAQMHASNRPQAQSQPNSLNKIRARDAPVLPLIKEKNKHQIYLEKKKFPWLSCERAAGWSVFQIYGVQPSIYFSL